MIIQKKKKSTELFNTIAVLILAVANFGTKFSNRTKQKCAVIPFSHMEK
jgi:hypothetical protein